MKSKKTRIQMSLNTYDEELLRLLKMKGISASAAVSNALQAIKKDRALKNAFLSSKVGVK